MLKEKTKKETQWLEENAKAINSYNEQVNKRATFAELLQISWLNS